MVKHDCFDAFCEDDYDADSNFDEQMFNHLVRENERLHRENEELKRYKVEVEQLREENTLLRRRNEQLEAEKLHHRKNGLDGAAMLAMREAGKSLRAIARTYKCSVDTVKSRIADAKCAAVSNS